MQLKRGLKYSEEINCIAKYQIKNKKEQIM